MEIGVDTVGFNVRQVVHREVDYTGPRVLRLDFSILSKHYDEVTISLISLAMTDCFNLTKVIMVDLNEAIPDS